MIGTAEEFISYAAARGVTVAEDEAPVLLVQATDYMNTFSWVGTVPAGQDDSWPRNDVYVNGEVPETPFTPRSIVTATYRVALAIADGLNIMGASGGAKVTEERVEGAVAVKYAEDSLYDPVKITGFPQLISDWLLSPSGSALNFPVMRG